MQTVPKEMIRDATSLGSTVMFVGLIIFTFLTGLISVSSQLLLGFLITFAVVIIIRMIYFKDRPRKQPHSNFVERIDASSFPSLHAARAVFIALVFIQHFSSRVMTVFLLAAAVLVIYSRIYLWKHDLWDVFGGIVLGGLTYWVVISFFLL